VLAPSSLAMDCVGEGGGLACSPAAPAASRTIISSTEWAGEGARCGALLLAATLEATTLAASW